MILYFTFVFVCMQLMRDLPNLGDKNKEPPLCYPYSVKARALIHAHLSRLELPRLTLKSGEKSSMQRKSCLIAGASGFCHWASEFCS